MNKPELIYNEYIRGRDFIRQRLEREAYPFCNAADTISKSNKIYNDVLRKAKIRFYNTLDDEIAIDVIRMINEYYCI